MNVFGQAVDWLRNVDNWHGPGGIIHHLGVHIEMSAAAVGAAIVVAIPVAVCLGHKRRWGLLAVNVSNVGRALPSFAILVVGSQLLSTRTVPVVGTWFVFIALFVLAVPPILTNSYVGTAEVSDDVRDAARGMGLSEQQSLMRIELPLAVPLIMAGVRTSAVQVVATATIAAYVGAGGLGKFIIEGYAVNRQTLIGQPSVTGYGELVGGAVLVAGLALVTEIVFAGLQRALTAKGLRRAHRVDTSVAAGAVAATPPDVAAVDL